MKDNIVYARGLVYDLQEQIQKQEILSEELRVSIQSEANGYEMDTQRLRVFLDEFDEKIKILRELQAKLYKLKKKWGFK